MDLIDNPGTWRFVPADDGDFISWSYGTIRNDSDLYLSTTFGPSKNLTCECGKYSGESFVDRICAYCGVKVSADAAAERRRRFGRIELTRPCKHPLFSDVTVSNFPIAPIGYRTKEDQTPNELGLRYERLVMINNALDHSLPKDKQSDDYYRSLANSDPRELEECLQAIVGFGYWQRPANSPNESHCLMQLFAERFLNLTDEASQLLRACGCALEVRARV